MKTTLSYTEQHRTMQAAINYAGKGYQALAVAWLSLDPGKRDRLLEAFPELVHEYGPGTPFYKEGGY
jgi:hypothetical protein